jgi:3-oxoacyl-[acyl-carrier protein] reductase
MKTTESRVALVTGAAQGLGRAIAERLARAGCALAVADIQQGEAERTAAELRSAGCEVLPLGLDVGDEAAVARAYAAVESHYGRLDILVNNAGIAGERAPIESFSLAGFEAAIRVNLTGTFLMCRGAIAPMRRQRWGRIVNLSSLTARGQPGTQRAAYTSSKAGIIGLSRVLADELGRDGITVNCVAPSRIRTPLTVAMSGGKPEYWERGAAGSVLGRLGEPIDIANAVAWLCSEGASFITGTVLDVNGGTAMR